MPIIDVVKWDAKPDEFVWKFPAEDLTTAARLIVSTSQEAFVILGGELTGPFGPGTHVLDTGNIPILRKIVNIPFGGKTPFSAEVWFVQKTTPLNLLWGTQDPIPLLDPKYHIPVPVRCFGQFGAKIADSRRFLEKLVGTHNIFDTKMLCDYFKAMVQTEVKSLVADWIAGSGINVFEINSHLKELSAALRQGMNAGFADFGVSLETFYVQSVNFPQDDPAVVSLRDTLAKRAQMDIIGYTYTQERSFDVLQGAAQNEGMAGTFAGAGIGLGLGAAVGGAVGQSVGQTTSGILNTAPPEAGGACAKCSAAVPAGAKFCPECGAPQWRVCCGKKLPANTKFCPECGKKLDGSEG